MKSFKIALPQQFSFDLTLSFLLRSPRELLHQVEDRFIYKALRVGQNELVLRIQHEGDHLLIKILNNEISNSEKEIITDYIREWFDLETDLTPFYAMASKDELLSPLVKKYEGYRIVGQPDLFESLVWAVLGQQINLAFAYTLKQRFVEQFGSRVLCQGKPYFLFPSPETTAHLNDEKLLPLQFSRQKSKYVVLIAQAFASGEVSKEKLKDLPLQEAKEQLMKIKGVGNWTANYALMKTFRYPDAFPLEDAGVHNAIKNLKKMKAKPTIEQVKRIFKKYKGWEAYATLYLWKSL
ncbi:MAG: DNA-3-methyladenine glycosylase family protein [Cyclobacteriaceae bacterium]